MPGKSHANVFLPSTFKKKKARENNPCSRDDSGPVSLRPRSERGARRGGADGQREAQESAQTSDHLLQLPAGGAAEEVPVGAVPGPAGAGRAGGAAGPHADTGEFRRGAESEIL